MRKRRYFSLSNKNKQLLLMNSGASSSSSYQPSFLDESRGEEEEDEEAVCSSVTKNEYHKRHKPTTTGAAAVSVGVGQQREEAQNSSGEGEVPIPQCHNIVSTSQIQTTMEEINLQRLASLFPFTSYDRKRFAAITIRLGSPHCTCLLFGSGKLVITGSTSFHACLVASQTITQLLREVNPRERFEVISCVIQNIVAHVELKQGQQINLEGLYTKYCEHSTYQKSIFPGLVLRPPESPIVLLVFKSGRIVCTGGKSYDDIYYWFINMFKVLKEYIYETTPAVGGALSPPPPPPPLLCDEAVEEEDV
jgi:transcription initiation factor TFIID TATA-box-binding protein